MRELAEYRELVISISPAQAGRFYLIPRQKVTGRIPPPPFFFGYSSAIYQVFT